jgi:hypothetical protein
MKPKTIAKIIRHKMLAWLDSIEDRELRRRVKKNFFVTGGCITSMLLNEDVNDYDLYFTDLEVCKDVANYYVGKFPNADGYDISVTEVEGRVRIKVQSVGVTEDDKSSTEKNRVPYLPIFLSDNAITLSDDVQLIIRFCGEPKEVHKGYDFVHCTNYWTFKDGLVLNQPALESILAKDLKYTGSPYCIASMCRARKFINRGWTISAGQILKIAWNISLLDLTDTDVLEDQLTGVDLAYFSELIYALKTAQKNDASFSPDYTYIAKLVDKIF